VVGAVAFEAEPLDGTLEGGGVAAGAGDDGVPAAADAGDEPLSEPAAAFCTPP
jgi:hypothetical protein